MVKKSQQSFSSVISVNPYEETYFNGISSFLTETKSPEFSKEQFAISYINSQSFINSQIEISKNIPDEDLDDAITNKAYDELALDQAVTYQIQFIETFNNIDEDNRHFHVFIVDPLSIQESHTNVIEKLKYLDVIIPTPLLLKSLYSKEIIENSGIHCYIYFQKNDTFITLYNEKEFIYTKSIKYSFIEMHERFCELYGERIEYDEFMDFLSTKNLRETQSEYKEYFIKLYKEIFANINDILTYVKRAFELEKINHIYIGSQVSTVTKLDEMAEVELSTKASNFEFDYGYESKDVYIDQLHALMHIYSALPDEEKYLCNFTNFHRPPKFIQRESGKLILLTAASLVLAFIYPVTYWVLTYAQNIQYELLQKENNDLRIEKSTMAASIKNRKAEKAKVIELLQEEEKQFTEKKSTLTKIHDVKVNYNMKAGLIYTLTKDLNRYKVKLEELSYDETDTSKLFTLELVSSSDKRITQLLEYLTSKHDGKFTFTLEKISYKEEPKKYFSELKVKVL